MTLDTTDSTSRRRRPVFQPITLSDGPDGLRFPIVNGVTYDSWHDALAAVRDGARYITVNVFGQEVTHNDD